jgi:hypothetical protein
VPQVVAEDEGGGQLCVLGVQVLGLGRERQQGGDSKVRGSTLIQSGNTAVRPYCIVFVTVQIPKNTLY